MIDIAKVNHLEIEHNHEAGLIPVATRAFIIALSARIAELEAQQVGDFQSDVNRMVEMIGGTEILMDKDERNRRAAEEFCELLQATGFPLSELIGTANWVYAKSGGNVLDEVGDVMNCLAALCTAHQVSLTSAANDKLMECFSRIDKIKEKQATKPKTFMNEAQQVAVVNPLEWERIDEVTEGCTSPIGDTYTVWAMDGFGYCNFPQTHAGERFAGGMDAAKAAAQAHHNDRILSATPARHSSEIWNEAIAAVLALEFEAAGQDCEMHPTIDPKDVRALKREVQS